MSKKIIFFDVDGTLVDVRPVKECIPESTIQAVHETRKKEIYVTFVQVVLLQKSILIF